ncbi:hypothetical protein ACOMHN_026345 [Nucella lapillus]
MSRDGNSVRKLPQGKLQRLKQQFEEQDAQASGAPLYGMSPRAADAAAVQPTVRSSSSTTTSPALSGRKNWLGSDFVTTPTPGKISKGQESVSQTFGHRHRWSGQGQDSSTPAGRKVVSPVLSKRLALFSDGGSGAGQTSRVGGCGAEQRGDSARRLSDTVTLRDSAAARKHGNERQRTMSDVISSILKKPRELSFHDRLKMFQEKPAATVLGQNMSSVSNAQRQLGNMNGRGNGSSASVPASPKMERNFDLLTTDNSALSSKKNLKSVEALVSPPAKPPRTFAHDEYLQTKILHSENPKTQSTRQSEENRVVRGKDRVNALSGGTGVKEEVVLRTPSSYSHLHQNRNAQGTGEASYAHPQPPHLRPESESAAFGRHSDHAQCTDSGDAAQKDGPVVISLKYRKKLEPLPPSKVAGLRRNPLDKLPETPKRVMDLQEFKLHKSFSSECLNKGSTSSLLEVGVEEGGGSPRSPGQLCGERARPSPPVRNPGGRGGEGPAQHGAGRHQRGGREGEGVDGRKRALGSSPSDNATPSLLTSTATPVTEQDVEKVPRKKMILVRQRINQAYEVLHTVFNQRPKSISEDEEHRDPDAADLSQRSEDTVDSDSTVDMKEIEQRVTYCSSVRLKTSKNIQKSREFLDKIYPQLFEYALIVGLCTKGDNPGYDPYVIHKFPQMVNCDISIPKFCFPDVDELTDSVTTTCESYSFVLTNIDGGRLYGYCRRIQPANSSLPEVLCIVSPVDGFNMYNKLLLEIEVRRSKSLKHAEELIEASFGRPLPSPGKGSHIRFPDVGQQMETILLERPLDQRLTNVNYESLLQYLGTDKLIKVFSSILMERRLILCSQHLSILTQTIHALVALLYPFHWQHVYIPLLPRGMLDVCAAPMPFIIGILQQHLDRVTDLELEDVIIVDLDKRQVLRSVGDEATILPKKVQKALKTAINMCKIDSEALKSQWLMVSEAFLRMFIEVVGHFPHYVCSQQGGSKTLLKDQFIAGGASKDIRQFLQWFTETQMFEVFISTQLEHQHCGSLDLFMTRLGELQSKREGSQSRGLGRKVKDLGKAIKTKLKGGGGLGELQSKREGSQSRGLGRKVKDLGKAIKTKLK